jgi:hypothetical protein
VLPYKTWVTDLFTRIYNAAQPTAAISTPDYSSLLTENENKN